MSVSIERTNEAILIKLPLDTDLTDLQLILNYFEYTNLLERSSANEEDINSIAAEAKKGWWEKNKDRFLGKGDFINLD